MTILGFFSTKSCRSNKSAVQKEPLFDLSNGPILTNEERFWSYRLGGGLPYM
jgi:hypothetical protein